MIDSLELNPQLVLKQYSLDESKAIVTITIDTVLKETMRAPGIVTIRNEKMINKDEALMIIDWLKAFIKSSE